MLWYKAWIDTRWRFIIGLAIVICSTAGPVWIYDTIVSRLSVRPETRVIVSGAVTAQDLERIAPHVPPAVFKQLQEQLSALTDFHAFVWTQVFQKNLLQMVILFACLLGCGGLVSQARGGGALFTLSLPVSRGRILWSRTGVALAELAALAFIPALLVPVFAAAVGHAFPVGDALVYAFSLFVGASVFFAAAVWLSTMFESVWPPILISLGLAFLSAVVDTVLALQGRPSFINVLSASAFFHGGQPPWLGLAVCLVLSAGLLYAAGRTLAVRDF